MMPLQSREEDDEFMLETIAAGFVITLATTLAFAAAMYRASSVELGRRSPRLHQIARVERPFRVEKPFRQRRVA
jgi:hypothetical protein